jgi:predicted O-methyltransferase YrrM
VDAYIGETLVRQDAALTSALEANKAGGLPVIDVSAAQGKMLHLLARSIGARRVLEIGTLGGYSTICLARALPRDGKLVTLEYEAKHADVARSNIARAGLSQVVDIRVGKAIESLPKLVERGEGPFDLVFIDADKPNNPEYLQWALRLSRVGTMIIVDNVACGGTLADAGSSNATTVATRRMFEMMAAEPRLSATAIQTVGSKGYDGFVMALVIG